MAHTMVNYKVSIHLPNRRWWPWVPPAVRSTHASLAAARWPMHTAWKNCKNYASTVSTHIGRVALQFIYRHDWRNGAVGLERGKQRLLVTIGKVVSQSKRVSHMGRKNGPKLASVLVPGKMGNSNVVHPEVQNTNWADWRIACRHWVDSVGPWCTCLESDVDRVRGYKERHTALKEGRVWKQRRPTKHSRRL